MGKGLAGVQPRCGTTKERNMSFIKNLFSDPKTPSPPNPGAIAGAQGAANEGVARLQAKLNRADTYTPFGSVTFEDLGDDRWKSSQTLSPEMQGVYDTQIGVAGGMGDLAQTRLNQVDPNAFSLDGVQDYKQSIDRGGLAGIPGLHDFEAARNEAEDAAFSRVWDRLGTQFDDEQSALTNTLANQGITLGSEAYTKAFDRFNQRKNDARIAAGYDSIGAGRDAYNNMFNNAMLARQQGESELMSDLNLANLGRSQAISDMLLERGQPMNELAALLQGSPAMQTPQPTPMAQVGVQAPDVTGAYAMNQQAQQNAYNQQMGAQNSMFGGLAGLGGSALMASALSDVRLKKNIDWVANVNGLNFYEYEYIWGGPRQLGVMAQEVIKQVPEAVFKVGEWFAVNYARLLGAR